jgi:hypothetical protein
MIPAGQRNQRITFERDAGGDDALGGEGPGSWQTLLSCFALVRYGTSAERRAAAGEQAVQTATFRVLATTGARSVTVRDRIQCDGRAWDVTGIAPIGAPAPRELEFTATSSLG